MSFEELFLPTLAPWEVAFRAAFIYGFVQLLFRLAGRKELGRYSIFDVLLLALVATAAREAIVANDSSLTSAMIGLTTIVGLDWVLSYLTYRSAKAADLIEGPVRQLVREGRPDEENLRHTRISRDDLLASARRKGLDSLDDVKDAYLERSGRITVIPWKEKGGGPAAS